MAQTFPLNPNAPSFQMNQDYERQNNDIPFDEEMLDAANSLLALNNNMGTFTQNTETAVQALLAMREGDNIQGDPLSPSADLEYADAFLEFAMANGLWGLPGSEHMPSENEIQDMTHRFEEHWANIHAEPNEQDIEEADASFAEWHDVALDFQEYAEYNGLYDNSDVSIGAAQEMWMAYLNECWEIEEYTRLNELGNTNEWIGVYPEVDDDTNNDAIDYDNMSTN